VSVGTEVRLIVEFRGIAGFAADNQGGGTIAGGSRVECTFVRAANFYNSRLQDQSPVEKSG
jgi:hypothetical protein